MIFSRFVNFIMKSPNFPFKEDLLFNASKKEDEISGYRSSRCVAFLEIILTVIENLFNRLNYHFCVNKIKFILR